MNARINTVQCVLAVVLCGLLSIRAAAQTETEVVDNAVRQLREPAAGVSEAEIINAMRVVEDHWCSSQDRSLGDLLLALSVDTARPVPLRVRAFQALLRCPKVEHADTVLRILDQQTMRRAQADASDKNGTSLIFSADVLRAFIDSSNKPGWGTCFADDDRTATILSYCVNTRLYKSCGNDRQLADPLEAIISAPLSPRIQSQFAERVVAESKATTVDRRVCNLVNPDSVARLRTMLQQADGTRPESVPYGIGFCLGHIGDEMSVPILEALATAVDHPQPTDVGATTFRPRMSRLLRSYATMIRAQRPPSQLVTVLGDIKQVDVDGGEAWLREWAMSRAVELGVDKTEVREALLAHAKAVRESVAAGPQPKLSGFQHPRLIMLNELEDRAVVLGLLRAEELPQRPKLVLPAH